MMARAALFVDLPNFYSELLRSGIEDRGFLRDYFLRWLDLDLLALALTDSFPDIWVFYSGARIGPSSERITGSFLSDYVKRINALVGVTARDANISGEDRELARVECPKCGPAELTCSKCGSEVKVLEWVSEKGVDAALTVHLFDTMDSWDTAFLLSGDADFVPAVASLRRRGKIIVGAGFPTGAPALVRECYNYVDLPAAFLREDVAAYRVFREDGLICRWFSDDLRCPWDPSPVASIKLGVLFEVGRGDQRRVCFYVDGLPGGLKGPGVADFGSRVGRFEEFGAAYPDQVTEMSQEDALCSVAVGELVDLGIERRLTDFASLLGRLGVTAICDGRGSRGYQMEYRLNRTTNVFEPLRGGAGV